MGLLDKLERKFGKYAIHNLSLVITVIYALGYVISVVNPVLYYRYLSLDAGMILKGQVWRIVTFILYPPSTGLIWLLIALYFYYMIATALERTWGSFRFNLYYISGMLFHVLGAFVLYGVTYLLYGYGVSIPLGTTYLNFSMFFAFAALYPDTQFLMFYIIPIKAKWLALLDAAFFAYAIVKGILPASITHMTTSARLAQIGAMAAALISLLNFLIFYIGMKKRKSLNATQRNFRRQTTRQDTRRRMQRTQHTEQNFQKTGARHRCEICGRTELTNPELEFRYCSKCNGAHEYCQDHLFRHEHIK